MTVSATIRDIAIIIIALQSIVLGVLLGVLVWQVWRLVKMLQTEIKPVITDVQETLGTVRGTTTFMSNSVVEPVIKNRSRVVGAAATITALTSQLRPQRDKKKGKEKGKETRTPEMLPPNPSENSPERSPKSEV